MKYIIALIKPEQLDRVRDALDGLSISGMTVTEVRGYGRQRGHKEVYRGVEYDIQFMPKMKIELAVPTELADKAVVAIQETAQSGRIGDGKIFVLDLENAIRIRTGEVGAIAL